MKWKTVQLGEVISIARGGSPRPIKSYLTDEKDGINWIKIGDSEKGSKYIYSTKEKIKKSGISKSRLVNRGDFVLSNSMSFGRPYIMAIDGCIHDGWLVLSDYKGDFNADFLYYLLSSPVVISQFESSARGSTVRNLNIELVSKVTVSYPPLPIQKQIVEKLDAAFADIDKAISATQKNIKNAEALFQSFSNTIFSSLVDTFQTIFLDEACLVDRGGSPRPIKQFITNEPTGVNWIKIGDTAEGDKYVVSTKQRITIEGSKKSRYVSKGDLILTNSMSYGRPYIMAINGYIHDGWFVLRLNKEVKADYFYYLLSSPFVQKQFHSLAAGAIVKNISGDLLKKTKVIIPPLKQQIKIIGQFENLSIKTDEIKEKYNIKLKNLIALKSSLLNQAFSNKLTKGTA